ncbi:phage protein NinX family protein [Paraburkholderia tropica]|uniref:phage protein NinX family protein n=1 Tax=Paraburkholderia tropica TaxID=92647 RepID=UPI00160720A2|nr:phage protein NinX family protein [Paraburkholderia tropica]MBB6320566.1 hypothetical protein [Paraburkholderia tropica]
MKVSELSGALLDYWVAKADGSRGAAYSFQDGRYRATDCGVLIFYSSAWQQAGPIIEREGIAVYLCDTWVALVRPEICHGYLEADVIEEGSTPLVAAMRAFVASKFGAEVSDEVQA